MKDYFEFYNFEKPHLSLPGKTPAEIYWVRDVVKKAA
jgi:transposase InsO family protein